MSTQCPDFATQLVDRLIFQICYADIEPLICVTKKDLVTAHDPVHAFIADYRRSGYQVFEAAKDNAPQDLISALKGRVSVLCGQSGAGKSTRLNSIEPSFQLRTQETSKALGRGRHTTRHCELHEVAQGWVADTPGFSSLDFHYMELEKLSSCIPDFAAVQGMCRFKDCRHLQEPGCAVKEAVEAGKISEIRYCALSRGRAADLVKQTKNIRRKNMQELIVSPSILSLDYARVSEQLDTLPAARRHGFILTSWTATLCLI